MTATPTVRGHVLCITELLELILLQLDMRTLLTSQRVCRKWSSLVRSSSKIQESLFFEPVLPGSVPTKVQNPLLAEVFPPFFVETKGRIGMDSFDMIKHPEKQVSYLRPEASWRRMLVQQPPAYRLGFYTVCMTSPGMNVSYRELPRDLRTTDWSDMAKGIRMEMFFEQLVFDWMFVNGVVTNCEIIWWGMDGRKSRNENIVEEFDEDPDILVWDCGGFCVGTDETTDHETCLTQRLEDLYRELGLEAKWPPLDSELAKKQRILPDWPDSGGENP